MQNYILSCTGCSASYPPSEPLFRCRKCNSILEVEYDYGKIKLGKDFKRAKITHAKYKPFFPVLSLDTLGEGGTPLIQKRALSYKGTKLFFKLEIKNPTHSFKDRGSSIEVSKAIELGFKEVCCASTGNMALSLATYARHSGLRCTVFVSRGIAAEKLAMIESQKARVDEIQGDYSKAAEIAEKYARDSKGKVFLCGDYHYRKEGQKSVIFEIIEQLHYSVPDFVFVQVGNATLLAAIYKGLSEFKRFSLVKKMPRLVAVQSKECDPFTMAYNERREVRYMKPTTRADAIAVGYPTFVREGFRALKSTMGIGMSTSDSEIEVAQRLLKKGGIESELGGAAGFAGFLEMFENSPSLFKGKSAVAIITGNN